MASGFFATPQRSPRCRAASIKVQQFQVGGDNQQLLNKEHPNHTSPKKDTKHLKELPNKQPELPSQQLSERV